MTILQAGQPRNFHSIPGGTKVFFSPKLRQTLGPSQPPIQRIPGALFRG
jgi:hypothetical protein